MSVPVPNQIWQTAACGLQQWVVVTKVDYVNFHLTIWHRPANQWWAEPLQLPYTEFVCNYKLWADVHPKPSDGDRGPLPSRETNNQHDHHLLHQVRMQLIGPVWKDNGIDYSQAPSEIMKVIRGKITEARDAFHHLWMMDGGNGALKDRYGNLEGTLQTLVTLMYHDIKEQREIEERWTSQ